MLKGKKFYKWILILVAVAVVLLFITGGIMMFGNYVSISGQHLNTYSCSSGGGMTGGYYRETIKKYDNHALISIESAEWHSQDPVVKEYLTDASVLEELEAVVRKYRMNCWHGKKFTSMFIDDGESMSYHFDFDDATVYFSSQFYPAGYSEKLAKLDSIVKKYIETGEKLPGLVNPKTDEEQNYSLPENELVIYVCSYVRNYLGLKILNGTDEDVKISEKYRLINADTDEVLLEDEVPYGGEFSQHSRDEMDIRLKERLQAGNYKIIFGELEIPFEIR